MRTEVRGRHRLLCTGAGRCAGPAATTRPGESVTRPVLMRSLAAAAAGRPERAAASATGTGSTDATRTCRAETRSWTSPTGDIIVLSPVGEIDMSAVPMLCATLGRALGSRPRHLVVDLIGARFCCVHAFALLADGAIVAARIGSSYAVTGMDRHQRRVATLLWGASGPRRHPSTAAAVIAIHDRGLT